MKRIFHVLLIFFLIFSFAFFSQNINAAENENNQTQTRENPQTDAQNSQPLESANTTPTVDLGTIVLGASPYGINLNSLPLNVTVITRKEIENTAGLRISDALENSAGVVAFNYGPMNALSSIRMRHGYGRETMILINGIRFMNNIDNSAYLSMLGLESFEQIEVLRGNGSLLYGPDGSRGAVNLITRKPIDGTNASIGFLYAMGGLDGLYKAYITGSHGSKNFYFFGSASYLDQRAYKVPNTDNTGRTDKTRINSDAAITNVLLTFGFKDNYKAFYSDFLLYSGSKDVGSTGSDAAKNENERLKKKDYTITNTTGYKLSNFIELKANIFVNNTVYENYQKNISTGGRDLYKFTRYGFDLNSIIKPVNGLITTIGFTQDWRRMRWDDTDTPANSIKPFTTSNTGVFAQVDYSISIIHILAGIRYDYQKQLSDNFLNFRSMISPTLGILVSILKDYLKFRTQLTKTYRMPELTEVRGYGSATYDKDLKPEKHWIFEAGLQSQIGKILFSKATFFYQYVIDALGARDPASFDYALVNLTKLRTVGFELEVVFAPLNKEESKIGIKIPVNFSYAKSKDVDKYKKNLVYAGNYEYMINAGLTVETKFGLIVDIKAKYVKNYDTKDTAEFSDPAKDFFKKYFTMDAIISFVFDVNKTKIKSFVKFLNLLNTKYAINGAFGSSYTMPGFTFMMGLEASF